jgi:hypothetical protein
VEDHAQPPELPTGTAVVVDRTLPGELAEGSDVAFGLALPRILRVKGRFEGVVYAEGAVSREQVANFVRQRVTADKVETGPAKTVFSRVTVRGHPGPILAVAVTSVGGTAELEVRDVTPKKVEDVATPDDRWRKLGLNPDGSPLDPTHLGEGQK